MPKNTKDNTESIRFADAIEELNNIVTQLEADDVDVDVMAQQVERAATLVALCRDRLDATRYRVTEIIVGLDGDVGEAETEPEDDTDE